jgi:hypothetical protein
MRRRVFDHVDPYLAPPWRDEPEPHEVWACPVCGRLEDGTGPCAHTRPTALSEEQK